jgi:hypothetical protein
MDGDGVLFVILAGLLALLPFDLWRGVPDSLSRMRWGLGGVIALLALLTLFEARDLTSRFSDIAAEADVVRTSYGLGFWLVGLGVLVAAVGWFRLPWRSLSMAGRETA